VPDCVCKMQRVGKDVGCNVDCVLGPRARCAIAQHNDDVTSNIFTNKLHLYAGDVDKGSL